MGSPSTCAGDILAVHAGRFASRIANADLPNGCKVLTEGDDPSLDEAAALVVLDPDSFPLDVLAGDRLDLPILVCPESQDDTPLFERLGFFDRVAAPDSAAWRELRRERGWAECQRVDPIAKVPAELSARLVELLRDAPDLRARKAAHRVRERVLKQWFAVVSEDKTLDALEAGVGDGRWAASLDPARYAGVGASEEDLRAARSNFPERRFDPLEAEHQFPRGDESFDFVFGVDLLQDEPPEVRKRLLSEMWRVARPGGRLVFVEDFVFEKPGERKVLPMTAPEFAGLALEATANRVVLDHVESFRYPGEDMIRGGLVSLLKLGSSETE
ncbi:MAG: class I SAM-dependent methyltransferase [Rubrobacteraceae bacterium]